MSAKVMTITPKKAAEWIKRVKKHRNQPTLGKIDKYANDMKNGKWAINGETIVFNGNGELLDGEGRLLACIKADMPFSSYVVSGISSDVFETIDGGKSRTLGNVLQMKGKTNYSMLASALRWLYFLEEAQKNTRRLDPINIMGEWTNFTSSKSTRVWADLLDTQYEGLSDCVQFVRSIDPQELLAAGVFAALYYLFSKKNKTEAEEFFRRLGTGENLTRDMNEYKLRNFLINQKNAIKKYRGGEIAILVVRVWNANRRHEEVRRFTLQKNETLQSIK